MASYDEAMWEELGALADDIHRDSFSQWFSQECSNAMAAGGRMAVMAGLAQQQIRGGQPMGAAISANGVPPPAWAVPAHAGPPAQGALGPQASAIAALLASPAMQPPNAYSLQARLLSGGDGGQGSGGAPPGGALAAAMQAAPADAQAHLSGSSSGGGVMSHHMSFGVPPNSMPGSAQLPPPHSCPPSAGGALQVPPAEQDKAARRKRQMAEAHMRYQSRRKNEVGGRV